MKLKSWIENLVKPGFYLWLFAYFMSGSCRQNIPVRLRLLESYMPLPSARRAVVAICFCWGLFLAIPSAVFGQTNYYAAYGTEYPVIGSLPGDQVYPDVALGTNGGYVVWQDNITDPSGEGISAMQLTPNLSGSGDIFQVNTTTTNDQVNAHVALLKNGGAVFVWQGGPGNMQHIYARFLSSSNLWLNSTDVLVSTFTGTSQAFPAVATLTNGNVVVVWESFNQAAPNSLYDVYGQMLSPTGAAIGANFLINQFTTYNQKSPAVAALTNGGFVVAWISETNFITGTNSTTFGTYPSPLPSVELEQSLFTVSGSTVSSSTGDVQVNQDYNPCSSPAIAVAKDGTYMITWCANNLTNSNSGWDIYERSFAHGVGGAVNLVNSYTYGDQYNPRISVIGNNYLIVWTSLGEDGSREGVYGQFVNEGDVPVGGQIQINTTTVGQQMEPAVASDGSVQFLAVWTGFTFSQNSFDLYAQRFENTEAVLEPMAAPFVWAPFVLSKGIYQPQLVVSWPPVQGLAVSSYLVFADGTNIATVTTNGWTMTAANGLTANSSHTFALEYVTSQGFTSPISPWSNGTTTWIGFYWGSAPYAIPYEWMLEYYGGDQSTWPMSNVPLVKGGPTLWQIFETGANPTNSATWMNLVLTKTSAGMSLYWNTQPGMTYQVQQLTGGMTIWVNVGGPQYAYGTNATMNVGNNTAGFYRVQLLRQ